MAKSEPKEVDPRRLRLRNTSMRIQRYRAWATMIEKRKGKQVAKELRALADKLAAK